MTRRPSSSALRILFCSTLASVLAGTVGIATTSAQDDCCGSVTACDQDACDSMHGWMDRYRSNRARKCGTVGTLFRWSANPCSSSLPQLDEPLVTDRPDFTEASSVVGLGVGQIELGYTYFNNDDAGVETETHSYPETLLRYGVLANWLELRVGWTYLNQSESLVNTSGDADLYLGFKIGLTPQEGIRPEMALIPQMFVPTGDADFTADEVLPGLNWIYAWEINDFLSTAGSTQFNRNVDDVSGETFTTWAQSWTIAYSLGERLGAYTEYFGLYPHSADTARPQNYANGGFTYLISNDIQWDIRGGVGLDDNADDYFVGTGLSIRFY